MGSVVRVVVPRRCTLLVVVCAFWGLAGCGSSGGSPSHTTGLASTSSAAVSTSLPLPHTKKVAHRRHLGPLGTVDRYWRAIGAGQYVAAFHYLASGSVPQTQAQFVSDETQAQIQNVDFTGRLVATTSSSATVAVTSLTTDDAQFGCRTWAGTYQLAKQANGWHIARANISPSRCPSQQPPSSPASSRSTGGATGASDGSTPVEGPGSTSHATDTQFCSTHTCIPNFPNGNGAIVQCADGEWSHSGGLSGACSYHGGEG